MKSQKVYHIPVYRYNREQEGVLHCFLTESSFIKFNIFIYEYPELKKYYYATEILSIRIVKLIYQYVETPSSNITTKNASVLWFSSFNPSQSIIGNEQSPMLTSLLSSSILATAWISCRAMSSASTKPLRRAAIAQLCSTSSKLQNLIDVAKCAGQASQLGASMLFLPECFGFIGSSAQETLENAEPPIMDDERKNANVVRDYIARVVQQEMVSESSLHPLSVASEERIYLLDGLRTIAQESGLWISAGGMHEAGAPAADIEDRVPRVYNSHVVLDNDGIVKALYRKIHLFDVSIPGKVSLRESATTAPGTKLVVCDSPVGKFFRRWTVIRIQSKTLTKRLT